MSFIASIFGGGREKTEPVTTPVAEPEPQASTVDPRRDAEISSAARQRQALLARRGRASLVTSRDGAPTRSGVSVVS